MVAIVCFAVAAMPLSAPVNLTALGLVFFHSIICFPGELMTTRHFSPVADGYLEHIMHAVASDVACSRKRNK